ncbi:TATE DNA Transposon [Leptomonas pyrrhocoris]|uniref:TATE DNA Transposon n=2 Tax=Leptomonas pyrrhocoris TaxID=157538 RepID=A0A0M9GAS3_LEPPY|nr:TATE DNA Transposon [Leptomonas pyrrhocoris]KPA86206.1 TATE DNA Transposon [Leptomonas pyrrhocoris]|eukprot:XP_015664645.1 TATE DNA Transposon [Leptomonas pyrrhocoris]
MVTREVSAASVGLYVLRAPVYTGLPSPVPRRRVDQRAVAQGSPVDDPHGEMDRALNTGLSGPLNWNGRHPEGCACPRDWFIHPGKPPHVSQVAWAAMNPQVRIQHRTWLENLRAMPQDLLSLPLHTAAVELVRRMGCARHWKWSTMARHYVSIQVALLQLPLYTNQTRPVDLAREPEWRQAISGARRFERESEPQPPVPLSVEEYKRVLTAVRVDPESHAFLVLMWACAARPGDVTNLLVKDIHFAEEVAPRSVRMQVTVRRGKGARFRGP